MKLMKHYCRIKKVLSTMTAAVKNQNNGTDKTLRLDSIETSKKHGYPICRLQIVGQNIAKLFTAREILQNHDLKSELTPDDLEKITRLDEQIKIHVDMQRIKIQSFKPSLKSKYDLTVTLQQVGTDSVKRVSAKNIIHNHDLLNRFLGSEAFQIGYSLGQKHSEQSANEFSEVKKTRLKNKKHKLYTIN
ncbi:hypothetical protein [Piscirickettsia salmonis]|uniref:hypothetical protein n=1 Tax=Piscirickettsia salmonis TaxID=1238 RepID=UPI0012BA8EC6|nr:hypothetical protein [Piscirickettsia salmonis]